MSLQEQIYSVLVVSASDAFNSALIPLLPDSKFDPVRFETSVNAAKRALADRTYDFIVINSPLPDDAGDPHRQPRKMGSDRQLENDRSGRTQIH